MLSTQGFALAMVGPQVYRRLCQRFRTSLQGMWCQQQAKGSTHANESVGKADTKSHDTHEAAAKPSDFDRRLIQ